MQRRLRILDDEQPRGAEGDRAVADLGPDRAAAAGDDDGAAVQKMLQPRIVDLDARPQQQILDIDRRKARHVGALLERRQPRDREAETARAHQGRFRLGVRLERRRREDHARDDGAALGEVVDRGFQELEIAENGNAADGLALIGPGRREDADRPGLLDRAALDRAQQHFGVGGASEDERRIGLGGARLLPGAGVAEVAVADPGCAQEHHLQHPIEGDGDLAEEELPEHVGRDQDVVEHQQRYGQHRRRAHDVHQVRERREPPLRFVEMKEEIDDAGIDDEAGQEDEQPVAPLDEAGPLEADKEARDNRRRGRQKIVRDDERSARAHVQCGHCAAVLPGPPGLPIPGFRSLRHPAC